MNTFGFGWILASDNKERKEAEDHGTEAVNGYDSRIKYGEEQANLRKEREEISERNGGEPIQSEEQKDRERAHADKWILGISGGNE